MTKRQIRQLEAGMCIRHKHSRAVRVILAMKHWYAHSKSSGGHSATVRKLHGSWTDPCPFTCLDQHMLKDYDVLPHYFKIKHEHLRCPTHGLHDGNH